MTPDNFTWQRFTHGIILALPQEQVFEFIATAHGLARWFIGACSFSDPSGRARAQRELPARGDRYDWEWLHKDLRLTGEVLEIERGRVVKYSFGRLFNVTFTLQPEGSRVRVALMQEYLPGAAEDRFAYVNCCVCWVFFLTNLKSVAESGCDLREVETQDEMLVNR